MGAKNCTLWKDLKKKKKTRGKVRHASSPRTQVADVEGSLGSRVPEQSRQLTGKGWGIRLEMGPGVDLPNNPFSLDRPTS